MRTINPLFVVDGVTRRTVAQHVWQKVNAGNNTMPDWVINSPVGVTKLGTPYNDSVTFSLDDYTTTDEYINSLISLSNNANITQTYVNGRKGGSIKQITGESDWDIIFNIKVFAEYSFDRGDIGNHGDDMLEIQRVGNGSADNTIQKIGQFINSPFETTFGNKTVIEYMGDYNPNFELSKLINFFNKFYSDEKYNNVKVNSLYLNNIFGIYNIIPYSIQTQQSVDETNVYNITINAYSDINDSDIQNYESEIIPK